MPSSILERSAWIVVVRAYTTSSFARGSAPTALPSLPTVLFAPAVGKGHGELAPAVGTEDRGTAGTPTHPRGLTRGVRRVAFLRGVGEIPAGRGGTRPCTRPSQPSRGSEATRLPRPRRPGGRCAPRGVRARPGRPGRRDHPRRVPGRADAVVHRGHHLPRARGPRRPRDVRCRTGPEGRRPRGPREPRAHRPHQVGRRTFRHERLLRPRRGPALRRRRHEGVHGRRRDHAEAACGGQAGPRPVHGRGGRRARAARPGAKVGAIGFCFGGGMVWEFVASGEKRLAAAAPFYGTTPRTAPTSPTRTRRSSVCTRSSTTA